MESFEGVEFILHRVDFFHSCGDAGPDRDHALGGLLSSVVDEIDPQLSLGIVFEKLLMDLPGTARVLDSAQEFVTGDAESRIQCAYPVFFYLTLTRRSAGVEFLGMAEKR